MKQYFDKMLLAGAEKIVLSKPVKKEQEYKKIVAEKKAMGYLVSKYTQKQVFHENLAIEDAAKRLYELTEAAFRQVNGFTDESEMIVLISKKGEAVFKEKKNKQIKTGNNTSSHNREKNYIFREGMDIKPLVDMGIFTKEGKVVNSMYDKYRQINRFIEIIDDEIKNLKMTQLNVIDFGCGKSYLTFLVYYYLTEVKGLEVNMTGLDLKKEVIEKCNEAARKYGYDRLHFEVGDINGYKNDRDVDMVITLHACDTATDYALFNAISWKSKLIFSVPCCQHELNQQMKPESLTALSRYGIIKERFSALATDSIRGCLLEYMGYKTQLLEFIDFEHTPKNILIRAVRKDITKKAVKDKALLEAKTLMKEFNFQPMLYKLLDI